MASCTHRSHTLSPGAPFLRVNFSELPLTAVSLHQKGQVILAKGEELLVLSRFRSSVRLLADDCVLYRNIHSLQDCLTLQEDLTSLGQMKADWQMKLNVAKCHSMRAQELEVLSLNRF